MIEFSGYLKYEIVILSNFFKKNKINKTKIRYLGSY